MIDRKMRIGVLTSGGDCAGLNAVIRAVTIRAVQGYGWEVVGIKNGTAGLMQHPILAERLTPACFSGLLLRSSGTFLGTSNSGDPFAYPTGEGAVMDRSHEVIEALRSLGLDALIGIGGDGSQAILRRLALQGGINMVAVPKTIDNDLGHTEASVGYATAVKAACDALDCLQPTAASHSRVMVLEVMGRDAGHIALNAGIAGGADIILIPEIAYRIDAIAEKVVALKRHGRNFALVVVAEAVRTESGQPVQQRQHGGAETYGGIGHYIGRRIAECTGAETRVTVLGHVQRGAPPTPRDRLMASAFGVHAVDLIAAGRFDRMVAWRDRQVIDVPITEAIAGYQAVDPSGSLVHTARGLGVCFGDEAEGHF